MNISPLRISIIAQQQCLAWLIFGRVSAWRIAQLKVGGKKAW